MGEKERKRREERNEKGEYKLAATTLLAMSLKYLEAEWGEGFFVSGLKCLKKEREEYEGVF